MWKLTNDNFPQTINKKYGKLLAIVRKMFNILTILSYHYQYGKLSASQSFTTYLIYRNDNDINESKRRRRK